ncbi:MAG TPA: ATP-binding protein [Gemmatimonadaceae bacterium]|nr:ATP-binding protein [Gemmatimonadaceae bacterium]
MSAYKPERQDDSAEPLLRNAAVRTSNSILVLQRRAEQELLEAKSLLEQRSAALSISVSLLNATLESAPDGVVAYSLAGDIRAVNSRFAGIWGLTSEQVRTFTHDSLMQHMAGFTKDRAAFETRLSNARTQPEREAFDVVELLDGRTFERIAVPQRIDGKCIGIVAHWRDATEQRRSADAQLALSEQLRQAQKMESLGALSGGIAHDFNNILSAILGNTELALSAPTNVAGVIESLTAIREAGDRAARLVQQILTFSRQQPHERAPMSVADTVREAARMLRVTIPAGIELTTALDAAAPPVLGDTTQLHRIVMNLCTNAMHALQERTDGVGRVGKIEIIVEHGRTGQGRGADAPGTLPAGPFVRLTIRDNGVGMDESTQARIFDPFFTTRPPGEGTGLGLSVVHGIMATHNGAIVVDSEPGQGTSFSLYFPAIAETDGDELRPRAVEAAPAEVATQAPTRVLYVDDDQLIVSLVSRLLSRSGCIVTGHGNAQEALDEILQRPDAFDVVITDFNMPELSGLDIARAVRQVRPELPIVITSGYISAELQEQADRLGIHEMLYKPDLARRLLQVVRAIPRTARRTG